MSAPTLYWYAGCSTCKKALSFLRERGVEPTLIELKTDPPGDEQLADLHGRSGQPLKKLFNTAGQSYRAGGWSGRIASTAEAEQLAALAADGMLIKRPLLDLGERVLIGFKSNEWAAALD